MLLFHQKDVKGLRVSGIRML